MKNRTKKISISRFRNGELSVLTDEVIVEEKLLLYIENKFTTGFHCCLSDVKEMIYGYLLSNSINCQKQHIVVKSETGNEVFSECISMPELENKSSLDSYIDPEKAISLVNEFAELSELFRRTGAVHSSALFFDGSVSCFAEDISRTHSIEKSIGKGILNGVDFSQSTLICSCRVNRRIAEMAENSNIGCIISRSAVSDKAIDVCRNSSIRLYGFVRGDSCNIY